MAADTRPEVIREMIETDIDPLASILGWPRVGIENRYREQVEGKRRIVVAEAGGLPVGSVSVNEEDAVPGLLHLFALDVAPAFQRRGIGTALIRRIESEAERRRLEGVWLDVEITNEDARRLYERLGFWCEDGIVVNRYTSLTSGRSVEETCYRMFKRSRESRQRLKPDS